MILVWKERFFMRRDYLSRLSRAARWYLPPAEAAEVLEDYREIVAGRSEEELRREVGSPRETARRLAQPKAYRRWLAVFLVLSACVLLPAVDPILEEVSLTAWLSGISQMFWNSNGSIARLSMPLFPLGIVLPLAWFQRNGGAGRAPSKRTLPIFALILLGIAWVWFLFWAILAERFDVINFLFPDMAWTVRLIICLNILIAGAAGMTGLFKSRLEGRRWRAMYIWGLTGVVLNSFLWQTFTCMTFESSVGWQGPYWIRLAFITAAGLLGTGVSLC